MPKQVLAVLVFVCACAADAADSGPVDMRPCSPGGDTPQSICALLGTKELVQCDREPFHYERRREGLGLQIKCHVYGKLPDQGVIRRWVWERGDTTVVRNMFEDWSDWPRAQCDVSYVVAESVSELPDYVDAMASMWVEGTDVSAIVQPPLAADSVAFKPEECTITPPTQM